VNLTAKYEAESRTGYDSNAYLYYHFQRQGFICWEGLAPSKAPQDVARYNRPS
jgi:hypothetical protein